MSPWPGACAVCMALLVLVSLLCVIVQKVRDWYLDRDIRRAFKEAYRLGLLEKWKPADQQTFTRNPT